MGKASDKIKEWYGQLNAFFAKPEIQKWLTDFKDKLGTTATAILDKLKQVGKRIADFFNQVKNGDFSSIKEALAAFKTNVIDFLFSADTAKIFDGIVDSIKKFKDAVKKHLVSIGIDLSEFGSKLSSLISSIKNFVSDNAGGLIALGMLLSMFLIFRKIAKVIELVFGPLSAFGDLAEVLGKGIKKLSKALSFKLKTEAVKNIAISIGILAASLFALSKIGPGELWSAVGALTAVIVAFGGLIFAASNLGDGIGDLAKLSGSVLMLSGALLVFTIAAKSIAGLDDAAILKTGLVLVGFLGFVKMLGKVTKNSSVDLASFGSMMLSLSGALILLGIAVGILGNMRTETLIKGTLAVGTFLLMMAGMMKATRHLEKDTPRFAASMAGLSAALLLLSISAGILGKMKFGTLAKGVASVGIFLFMMVGVMKAANKLSRDIPKFGTTMLGLSFGLLAMATTVKIIAGIEGKDLIKGGLVITAFLGLMVGMMAATKLLTKNSRYATQVGVMMLSFAGAMIILTGAIGILAMIKPSDLAKATTVITVIGGIFAGLMYMSKFVKGGKGIKSTLITMSVSIGILAASLAALSFIDPSKLAAATGALGVVMGMFALMTASTKFIGTKTIGTLIALTGIVAILSGIIYLLSDIPADGALKVAGALSALILSLSASCVVLAVVGNTGPAAFIGIGVLAALMGVIALFAGIAVASLPAIGNKLSEFMNNLSGFLDGAAKITPDMANGVKTLADSILILTGAGTINSIMFGAPLGILAKQLKPLADGLSDFSEIIGDSSIDSSKVKAAAEAAQALAGVSLTLSDIGWINHILGLGDLSQFGSKLKGFGEGLAAFSDTVSDKTFSPDKIKAAADAASSLVGLSASLADVGWINHILGVSDLSQFGTKLSGFGEGLSAFSDVVSDKTFSSDKIKSAADAASSLVGLSTALADTGWINHILGVGDLSTFGTKLRGFGDGLASFSDSVSDKTFSSDKIKSAADAASSLVGLSTSLADTGWISHILGVGDLSDFGSQLGGFGDGLAAFSTAVSTKDFSASKIKLAADAATSLASVSSVLSDTSWISAILGLGDLSTFGSQLGGFGNGLAAFSTAVSTKDFNSSKIKSAADAAASLANVSSILADTSWISAILGLGDLSEFGSQLGSFGTGLAAFSTAVSTKDFNSTKIKSAADAAASLAGVSSVLADTSWISAILGLGDLSTFGSQLGSFGEGLAAFSKAVSVEGFNADNVTTATDVATGLADIAKTVGDNSAGWDWLTGKDGLDAFGTKIETLGTKLASFCETLSGDDFDITSITSAITEINKFARIAERLGGKNVGDLSAFGYQISSLGSQLSIFYSDIESINGYKFSSIATGLEKLASINVSNADAVQSFITSLGEVSADGVEKFTTEFENADKKVLSAISTMMQAASTAITTEGIVVKSAAISVALSASKAAKHWLAYMQAYNAGVYVVQGFSKGITASTFMATAAAVAMAQAALNAARALLKINSPSKVFMKVGQSVPEGFSMGIDKLGGMVVGSTTAMAENALNGTRKAIARISDIVNSDIDSQPTIRPVMDLTDVEYGANAIDSLLSMNPSVGAIAKLQGISASMNNRQNGSNGDVISAIKDLGSKLGNMSGNTYNVNGVTYDDGSNISDAVKTLIRAARVERRV